MPIQNEMLVRRICIHANRGGAQSTVCRRQKPAQQISSGLRFIGSDLSIDQIGLCGLAFVMNADLYTIAQVRKPIEKTPVIVFADKDGQAIWLKEIGVCARLEPEEDLPLDTERQAEFRNQ